MDPRPFYHLFYYFSLCRSLDCDYIINDTCEYVNTAKHSFHLASLRGCLTFSSSQTGGWFTRKHRQKPPSPRSHFLLTTASQRTRFPPSFPPPTPIPLPNPLAHNRSPQLVRLFTAPSPAKPVPPHAPFCVNLPTPHPNHSSHSTKIPATTNFVYSAQLFRTKHIQNYYVASP